MTTQLASEHPLPDSVRLIGQMHFEGNIIPHEFYNHIKTQAGKTDLPAIIILAEIIYWYRPIKEIDEATGKLKPLRKKFSGDRFQCYSSYFTKKFGLTEQQVRSAFDNLKKNGLIKREIIEIVMIGSKKFNNVPFVEPIPKKIAEIINQSVTATIENEQLSDFIDDVRPSVIDNTPPSVIDNRPSVIDNRHVQRLHTETTKKTDDNTGPLPARSNCDEKSSSSFEKVVVEETDNIPGFVDDIVIHSYDPQPLITSDVVTDNTIVNPPNRPSVDRSHDQGSFEPAAPYQSPQIKFPDGWTKEQKNQAAIIMANLPSDEARRQIVSAMDAALKRGPIENFGAYMSKILKNHRAGDFTLIDKTNPASPPVSKSSPMQTTQNIRRDKAIQAQEIINSCQHCDETGYFRVLADDEEKILVCNHQPDLPTAVAKKGHKFVVPTRTSVPINKNCVVFR